MVGLVLQNRAHVAREYLGRTGPGSLYETVLWRYMASGPWSDLCLFACFSGRRQLEKTPQETLVVVGVTQHWWHGCCAPNYLNGELVLGLRRQDAAKMPPNGPNTRAEPQAAMTARRPR